MKRAIQMLKAAIIHAGVDPDFAQETEQAISLIEAHLKFRECGPMPGDSNAALWDLEHSLSIHRDMAKAHAGHPKGEYHERCIREIEEAIWTLKSPRIEELRKERDRLVADRDSLAARAGKMWKFLNELKRETAADAALIEQHGTKADQEAARMARAAVARIEEAMR
jgi:hypothetical protein